MQTTFFVEMRFWLEGLAARCYKDHGSKRMLGRIGMILWSLETYGYIGSKTKNYQNIKRISSAIYLLSRSRSLGRIPSNPIPQAACLQALPFRPHAFRILDKYNIRPSLGS